MPEHVHFHWHGDGARHAHRHEHDPARPRTTGPMYPWWYGATNAAYQAVSNVGADEHAHSALVTTIAHEEGDNHAG